MAVGSIYFYCLITLQKASTNAQQSSSPLIMLLGFILSNVILNQLNKIERFFSRYWSFLPSQLSIDSSKDCEESADQYSESFNKQFCFDKKKDDTNFCRDEIQMVMENLGLFCSQESKELKDSISSDELSQLFDEEEPSLEEVKEAFDIFDQNTDGFIDAEDLQRVIHKLQFKERFTLESCRKMIKRFDKNGDERIDLNEFVKFMENSFC